MLTKSHVKITASIVTCIFGINDILLGSLLGAILPDIDTKNSKIGRYNPFAYIKVYDKKKRKKVSLIKHRAYTHSWRGLRMCALILLPVLAIFLHFGIGVIIGYAFHLLEDSITKEKIPLNYPDKQRYGIPLFTTGSLLEKIVANIIVCASIIYMFV